METLEQTLAQRVEETLALHYHEKILTTTGTRAALEELAQRSAGLEKIVRELAAEVERLGAVVEEFREPSNRYTVAAVFSDD